MAKKILGIMSGSSLDGLDLAICSFNEDNYTVLHCDHFPFNDDLVTQLKDPLSLSNKELLILNANLSRYFADAVNQMIVNARIIPDMIVSHGHTIFHDPDSMVTCQLGNGGIIASLTGIDTLCDLRIQDVALGGQGAPLASLVDKYLFDTHQLQMNLGGIANVSFTSGKDVKSWDICPCNQVLNYFAGQLGASYDENGAWAKEGSLNQQLYDYWQNKDYFNSNPPKSLDNYWVKENFLELNMEIDPMDGLHTMCKFIADRIIKDLLQHLPKGNYNMIITGGGTHNDFLINLIDKGASTLGIKITIPEVNLIDYKEAILMAYMGYRYLEKMPNVLSSATGGKMDITAGALYKGHGEKG